MKNNKYVEVIENGDIIDFESPTYGTYKVRKILCIDYITACEEKKLKEVLSYYNDVVRPNLGSVKIVKIDTKQFGDSEFHKLSKFYVYTAFNEDNLDWVDPKNYLKKLPVALSKERIYKIIS